MNLSNTGGGGRGSDKGDVVGTMILHSMLIQLVCIFILITQHYRQEAILVAWW